MDEFQHRAQVENGPRYAQTATYKGLSVEVATGYNGTTDNWPVHVYITKDGERFKPGYASLASMKEAFDWGFDFARQVIDQGF